jgi:hypothetical protein
MSNRTLYISRNCPHCKKLLIGVHKYEFLRNMFIFVDVATQNFPDYIQSVPTLVIDQNMIKADDVFGYLNNMVEQIFKSNPELKQRYHPEQSGDSNDSEQSIQGQQIQGQQIQGQQIQGQQIQKPSKGEEYDPVDDLIGWCPDGGCSFSEISEKNDDCAKASVTLDDTMFSFITEGNDQLAPEHTKVSIGQDNSQFQKSEKQQQMDSSYERLMEERQLIK